MLTITRKEGESVNIFDAKGNRLGQIKVCSIKGGSVRVAFDTPSLGLVRAEIQDQAFKGFAKPTRSAGAGGPAVCECGGMGPFHESRCPKKGRVTA